MSVNEILRRTQKLSQYDNETTQLPPRAAMPMYERDIQQAVPWMAGFKIVGTPNTVELQITESTTLGRQWHDDAQTHINLMDYGAQNAGVSRVHAKLRQRKHHLAILDLGSTNGTYLNGYRLEPFQDVPLQDGDLVELGNLKLKVIFLAQMHRD